MIGSQRPEQFVQALRKAQAAAGPVSKPEDEDPHPALSQGERELRLDAPRGEREHEKRSRRERGQEFVLADSAKEFTFTDVLPCRPRVARTSYVRAAQPQEGFFIESSLDLAISGHIQAGSLVPWTPWSAGLHARGRKLLDIINAALGAQTG